MAVATKNRLTEIGGDAPTNGALETIVASSPYIATVILEGTSDILFHRWNVESVAEKAKAAKGSKAKKSDDVESYVYRNDDGLICIPGKYVRGAIIGASRFRQDPRSPRKSAMDLYKAGIVSLTELAPILVDGKPTKDWQYEHRCRVTVQRNGITRTRPAFKAGWKAEFQLSVLLPEYIDHHQFHDSLTMAGKIIGLADDRPTYGRFSLVKFDVGLID